MPPRSKAKPRMQLQVAEQALIDKAMRVDGDTATDAVRAVNAARVRKGILELDKSSVHRYVGGATHKRAQVEKIGCKRNLSPAHVRQL